MSPLDVMIILGVLWGLFIGMLVLNNRSRIIELEGRADGVDGDVHRLEQEVSP